MNAGEVLARGLAELRLELSDAALAHLGGWWRAGTVATGRERALLHCA